MQSDQARRVGQFRSEFLQHDARRIAGEHRRGLHARLESRVQFSLGVEILKDCFNDDIGERDAIAGDVSTQARRGFGHLDGVVQPFGKHVLRALHGRSDEFLFAILQRDVQAAQRAPGCNIAAHDPGADHMHVLQRNLASSIEGLEPILQVENADQIARRRGHEELGD